MQALVRCARVSFPLLSKNPFRPKFALHQVPSKQGSTITLRMAQSAAKAVIPQKKVVIPNKYGEKLVGILHETGSLEIAVLCHGFRRSKEEVTLVSIATALEKEGISAFRFDFSGNGESEGSFEFGNYSKEADDLHSVVEHFREANRVISAIVGHSKGAGVVLLYASKYRDVETVVNLSGRYDLRGGVEAMLGKEYMQRIKENGFIECLDLKGDVYRVTEASLMERLNTNMHDICLHIDKDCRVLTVHGSVDEDIPVEDAIEFDKVIPNNKLHIIEGADHAYTSHQEEVASVVSSFIKTAIEEDQKKCN